MSYCRTIIFLSFIFINGVYAYIPYAYNLPHVNESPNREFELGWPNPSILDFGHYYQDRIFAGTGEGPGMIDYLNFDETVPIPDYLYKITNDIFIDYIIDSNSSSASRCGLSRSSNRC